MPKWTCEKCGYPLWGWAPIPKRCPNCGGKMLKFSDILQEEEESEDHYSFWRGYNLPRLWDRSWGPFGPRRGDGDPQEETETPTPLVVSHSGYRGSGSGGGGAK